MKEKSENSGFLRNHVERDIGHLKLYFINYQRKRNENSGNHQKEN